MGEYRNAGVRDQEGSAKLGLISIQKRIGHCYAGLSVIQAIERVVRADWSDKVAFERCNQSRNMRPHGRRLKAFRVCAELSATETL